MSASKASGFLHVITGPGKGKTTAAFGMAMRASGHGMKVCIVQFMKTGGTTGEVVSAQRLGSVLVAQFGTGRFIGPEGPGEDDIRCAREGLDRAKNILAGGKCDLLILDEVSTAVKFGLFSAKEVLSVTRKRGHTEVVLTGRDAPGEFVEAADYASYIDSVRHPYAKGVKARKGIEW